MDRRKASVTFALLSTASLLGAVNQGDSVVTDGNRTHDALLSKESQTTVVPWDQQLRDELGNTDELLKTYSDAPTRYVHQQNDLRDVTFSDGNFSSDVEKFSGEEESKPQDVWVGFDGDYETEMHSSYALLGNMMFNAENDQSWDGKEVIHEEKTATDHNHR